MKENDLGITSKVDGGELSGLTNKNVTPGYAGRDGLYLILSSFKKKGFDQRSVPTEIRLNTERVYEGEEGEEHRYAMMLSLVFLGQQEALDSLESQKSTVQAALLADSAFLKKPDGNFACPRLGLEVRYETLQAGSAVVIDLIDPIRDLQTLTNNMVPKAVGLFNTLFPDFKLSESVVLATQETAAASERVLNS